MENKEYIVLFGKYQQNIDWSIWYDWSKNIAEKWGYSISHSLVEGVKGISSKAVPVKKDRLEKALSNNNPDSASLFTIFENMPLYIWEFASILDRDRLLLGKTLRNIKFNNRQTIISILLDVLGFFDFQYGFVEESFEPECKMYGILGDETNEEEEEKLTKWSDEIIGEKRYLNKIIYDVFQFNVLSESHLNRQIGSLSLKKWIQKEKKRGEIKAIKNSVYLWTVEHENIDMVRFDLNKYGVLV